MTARRGIQWGHDEHGRLVGLSKVDTWTKQRAGRASRSPWRLPYRKDAADAALRALGVERRPTLCAAAGGDTPRGQPPGEAIRAHHGRGAAITKGSGHAAYPNDQA
jgi:hypothetical protein